MPYVAEGQISKKQWTDWIEMHLAPLNELENLAGLAHGAKTDRIRDRNDRV